MHNASPLFNGNTDYAEMTNEEGTPLISQTTDNSKWQAAANAAKDFIDEYVPGTFSLYRENDNTGSYSPYLSTRNVMLEDWNEEIIYARTRGDNYYHYDVTPLHSNVSDNAVKGAGGLSVTQEMVDAYFMANGKTIDDPTSGYVEDGFSQFQAPFDFTQRSTYNQWVNREPRFYADLGFDGSMWYKRDALGDETKWHIEGKFGQYSGSDHPFFFNETGYYCKKLVNWRMTFSNDGGTFENYAWPEMRLADLYLLYAEALNEIQGPTAEVYSYLDQIRERAGLDGVVESWAAHSNNPSKPLSKEGLRSIIQQERMIELAFEGQRYWDLLRWKRAVQEFNDNVQGWNIKGDDEASYYQIRTIHIQNFISPRDYFWPLSETSLIRNTNLVQNPGW